MDSGCNTLFITGKSQQVVMGKKIPDSIKQKGCSYSIGQLIVRTALLAFLWWILVGMDVEGWIVGIPVILAAALISLVLTPVIGWRFRPFQAIRFLGYFIWSALKGGVDVTSRAFHPNLPIKPGFITHYFRLPPGSPRVFMADVASLLPGTLSSGLEDKCLVIHALDMELPVEESMDELESRVADLFGVGLAERRKEGPS
jgi:multicomponent Na+:H+ antiporter subunit E